MRQIDPTLCRSGWFPAQNQRKTIDNGTNPHYLPARQRPVSTSFPQQTELRYFGAHEYPQSRESELELLLSVPLVTVSLVWNSAATASCNFLSILASIGSGDGQVLTPRAIAIDPSDNVFVADQNDRVQKFNSSGVFQFRFATGGSSTEVSSRFPVSQLIGQ
jgi:hypothetical protein